MKLKSLIRERSIPVNFVGTESSLSEKLRNQYQRQLENLMNSMNDDAKKYIGQIIKFHNEDVKITQIIVFINYEGEIDVEIKGNYNRDA